MVGLSKAGMASLTGQCHTFSENADGYVRGEGCDVVIIKELEQVTDSSARTNENVTELCVTKPGLLFRPQFFVLMPKLVSDDSIGLSRAKRLRSCHLSDGRRQKGRRNITKAGQN
jgi:hypothetical protein